MAAFLSVAAVMTVVVASDPAVAGPPPKKTVTRVSDTFTCTNYEHELIGGGTLTKVLRRTSLTPLEGELFRTRVEGKYRFVADNGKALTYRIDYIDTYSGGLMWEGWFIMNDFPFENLFYADPGWVMFSAGGYTASHSWPLRSVCDELGYELEYPS